MNDLFLIIINMSISASWLVLAVLLLRFVLKKAPKWVNVLLWGIVAVRLAFPFSIESALSLIPSAETISPGIMMDTVPSVQTGVPAINSVINPVIGSSLAPTPGASANPLQIWIPILSIVWVAGVVALLLYTVVSYCRLQRKVSEAVILRDNIFQSENVASPFVLGLFRPKIYLPYNMDGQDLNHVVAHEQAHIRRRDHWWKPLGFLLLTIHWFNPLMWLAYVLLCRDIELACDEKVIKELGNEQRADYTQALVACSVNRRMIAACPLAFGEVGVKERVKSVMNYKKPAFWVVVLAVIACVVVAVCFLTNPEGEEQDLSFLNYKNLSTLAYQAETLDCIYPDDHGVANGSIEGRLLGEFLNEAVWNELKLRDPYKLEPDIQISFDSELYLGFSKSQPELAIVSSLGKTRWYTMINTSFDDVLALIKPIEHAANVTKWFDYLKTPEEMHWDGRLEINLPDFPDVTFRWYPEKMEAVTEEGITPLYTGMPIWNTYFCDLSGDGLPELCSTISWGSGMIDNRVIVYDYANGVSFSLEDRGVSDYTLRQDESDGQLYVDKTAHMGGGLLSTGRLVFEDDCLQVLWPEKPNDGIREITDPTDDPNFAYDTAVEKIFEDTNNEYFIGGLYSQNIIVHYNDGTQEDIVTALNSGRATFADLDRFGIRYWAEPKIDPLETAISSAILDHYASKQPDGRLHVESHVLLANEVKSGTPLMGADNHIKEVTVYLLVFHEKYSTYGGALEAVGGSYVPTAITFSVSGSEEYTLKEYWEPRDGSYYTKDVQAKFPGSSAEDALNDQAYIDDLQAQNYSKALAYLNSTGGLELRIAELLDTICASPGVFASSPAQYIEAHEAEYQELLGYREYTLRFCFSEFLRGGQTDLRSHIMRAAIDEIAPEAQLRLYAETGQVYFDEWKAAALRVSAQHEMEWIEKNQPAIYLLLQMLDSEMVADADAGVPQMSFAGLAYGNTLIDEEVFEVNSNGAALEYQLTYTRPTIILEVGLVAKNGAEFFATVQDGTGTGVIEGIPAGSYQLFVRNVGCISDLPGKTVEGGAMVCKLIESE